MCKAAILLVLLFGSVISGPLEKAHKVNNEKRVLNIVTGLLGGLNLDRIVGLLQQLVNVVSIDDLFSKLGGLVPLEDLVSLLDLNTVANDLSLVLATVAGLVIQLLGLVESVVCLVENPSKLNLNQLLDGVCDCIGLECLDEDPLTKVCLDIQLRLQLLPYSNIGDGECDCRDCVDEDKGSSETVSNPTCCVPCETTCTTTTTSTNTTKRSSETVSNPTCCVPCETTCTTTTTSTNTTKRAQCTLPSSLQGSTWTDIDRNLTLSFEVSTFSGYNINAQGELLDSYTCISNTDNVYVFKSDAAYSDEGESRWIYICMRLTEVSPNLFYYYLLSDQDFSISPALRVFNPPANDIPNNNDPTCDFCQYSSPPAESEFHLLQKTGTSESYSRATFCVPCETTCKTTTTSKTTTKGKKALMLKSRKLAIN